MIYQHGNTEKDIKRDLKNALLQMDSRTPSVIIFTT